MRIFRWIIGCVFVWSVAIPAFAETIQRFEVNASLAKDSMLIVTERITYDFGEAERHGIYRSIPVVSERNGSKYRLHLKVMDAKMDGQPTNVRVTDESSEIKVRVGDPDLTVTGEHVFEITYRTNRAVNFFEDHVELYWNVTGNDWEVPIESSSFSLTAPTAANRTDCFTGPYGSTERACRIEVSGNRVSAVARPLDTMEGFTVVVGFPNGVIQPPAWWERFFQIVRDNPLFSIPLFVFLLMFAIWWKFGKEPKGHGTIIAQYGPPAGMTPALMAALDEQWVPDRVVSATILDLAVRGYLKIKFTDAQKTFRVMKIKEADVELLPYEAILFKGLFVKADETSMRALKNTYWKEVAKARKKIFRELKGRGLFNRNPAVVRATWMGIAVLLFLFLFALSDGSFGNVVVSLLVGFIVGVFGYQMPRMTKNGAVVLEEVNGFERFLSVTEKARLDFTDAPERTPEQFSAFLPAAVAFGVETKWAGQFSDIMMSPPSYFEGPSVAWTAVGIAHVAGEFNRAASYTAFHAPTSSSAGSGGSGFSGGGSGGGGGGGGGGSW